MTVAMHAERTSDPQVVRWVVTDRSLDPALAGTVDRQGAGSHPLARRLLDRVWELAAVEVGEHRLEVRKRPGAAWDTVAPKVQAVLHELLEEAPAQPLVDADGARTPAEVPTPQEAAALVEAAVGETVASHGGRIEVVQVADERITVRLHGACHGCPAARATLIRALDGELRARFPRLREVGVAR